MLNTLFQIVREGGRSILMSSHLMDDVQAVCEQVVMIHKGRVVHRKIDDLAKQIDREIEITVWGGASQIELALKDAGLTVRRMGRVMRILRQDESTVDHILDAAAKSQVQVRQMQEYEPSLEDLSCSSWINLGMEQGQQPTC